MEDNKNIKMPPKRRMGPPGRGMAPVEKAKDFKGSIGKLIRYIGSYKIAIIFVAVMAVCSTVFSVVGPKVLGKATTALSEGLVKKIGGTGGIDFGKIGTILIFVLCLYAASAVFNFVQGWIMTGITQKVCYRLRKEISEKINRMPMKYFESRTYGEVLSRITNDVDTLGMGLNQSITTIITSLTTMIGVLVMMLSISPLMTLIAVIILPISVGLVSFVVKKSQGYFKTQQEYLGHINGQIEETYGGHMIVKSFNKEKDMVDSFNKTNDVLYGSAWKSQFLSGMMQPIMMFVGNLGYACVALTGGLLAIKNVITIGDIQAFIQYVKNFTQPIQQIAQVINQVQSMTAASERVFEFLEEEEEEQIAANPVPTDNIRGEVEFKHVKFGYKEDQIIIKDFCANVKPGQKVAIVGPTGAGKTTLVNLLMRFYELNKGKIEFDGCDITKLSRGELRRSFGMVLQNTWLFEGTVADNIAYGKMDATREQIIEAAEIAQCDHFIRTLPEGYDTIISSENGTLSQGQQQLLTIARVILANPPVVILDEATSSVDTRTEALIQQAMEAVTKDRTSFVIAHRLSTIENADMILVMKNGDIVEKGTHSELLQAPTLYASLYNSQFQVA